MATASAREFKTREIDYPTRDGRPMGETPVHRQDLTDLIFELETWYRDEPMVYVSGNMMMYYVPGDKRRHVSPDVFVTKGIAKSKPRKYYLVWEEKSPDVIIELTSKSTRKEDLVTKFDLYEQTLKVPEYFLFDPFNEYLNPGLQGFRLARGVYRPIKPVAGRLSSRVLKLHLERDGQNLRLFNPATGRWLLTPEENRAEKERLEEEVERLRQQLQAMKQQRGNGAKE